MLGGDWNFVKDRTKIRIMSVIVRPVKARLCLNGKSHFAKFLMDESLREQN